MARINTRQVEAFRAVMLTGGMTPAAELMGVTQPAVSRLVRSFEESLGLALFERRGNQVLPTPDAAALLTEVERSFVGLDRIADLAQAIRSHSAGSLRVVALPALATGALPRFLGGFLRRRPELRVFVHGMPSHLVAEAIAAGQADVGFAAGPLERPGFLVEPVPGAAVVVMHEGHRLARKPVVQAEDLAGEHLIAVGSGTLFRARVDSALAGIDKVVRWRRR